MTLRWDCESCTTMEHCSTVDRLNLATPPSPKPLDIVMPNHFLRVYTGSRMKAGTVDRGLISKDINYITYILCIGHKLNTVVLNIWQTVFFIFYGYINIGHFIGLLRYIRYCCDKKVRKRIGAIRSGLICRHRKNWYLEKDIYFFITQEKHPFWMARDIYHQVNKLYYIIIAFYIKN